MIGVIPADTVRKLTVLLAWGVGIVFLAPVLMLGQGSKAKTEKTPGGESTEISGAQLYHNHCASCHGLDGKGNGPAAPALKAKPTDLTQLAKNNGGKFPSDPVWFVLSNKSGYPSHGSKDMPIWGPIFSQMEMDQGMGSLRVHNLTEYLKSIQAK